MELSELVWFELYIYGKQNVKKLSLWLEEYLICSYSTMRNELFNWFFCLCELQVFITGILGYVGARNDFYPNRCLVSYWAFSGNPFNTNYLIIVKEPRLHVFDWWAKKLKLNAWNKTCINILGKNESTSSKIHCAYIVNLHLKLSSNDLHGLKC